MEMFALLSQHHQAGGIDDATFGARRREIFEQLGLEVPNDGLDPKGPPAAEADAEDEDTSDDLEGEAATS